MNKKRTKAIRNFLALLVLLTTGGTQQVWADETQDLSDINSNLTIDAPNGSGCTAVATGCVDDPNGHCELLKVVLKVTPKPGYYTNLDLITATNGAETPADFDKYVGDDVKTVDPADLSKDYSAEREIVIYWKGVYVEGTSPVDPTPYDIKITVKFKRILGLELRNGLGESRAKVTFFDGGTTDPTATFNPTDATYGDANAITEIDNADGKDRYIIAHIVPARDYWTDKSILYAIESADGSSALTRGTAPDIESGQKLKLLKADEYNAASSEDAPDMRPCQNGAGWYYYILPGSHQFSFADEGYKFSSIDGFAPEKFELHNSERTTMTGNVLTVTDGTTNGWKAVLTYDKLNFTFDCNTHCPQVTKLSISNQGTTWFDFDGSTSEGRAAIDKLVKCGPDPIPASIWPTHYVQTRDSQGYPNGWFVGTEGVAIYSIDVPFTPLNPSDAVNLPGSEDNPWLIRNADELNMLSKCYTIGAWYSNEQYFKQTADIDMSEVNDFLPIGVSNPGVSFRGHYDGNGKTISGIKVTYSTESDPLDPTPAYVGLFGLVEGDSDYPSSVKNVTLVNSSFSATAGSCAVAVGGIAGSIQGSNPTDATISNCKVLVNGENAASAISGLSTNCATGAIVGNFLLGTLSQNYYGYGVTVSNSSGTASGYTKRGTWKRTVPLEGGTATYAWDDFTPNDGAMLWVKKASIGTITKPTDSKAVVTFNEKTVGDNCYAVDGDNIYYAVGQKVTLLDTPDTRTSGIFTFQDELTALTMSDGTTNTYIKETFAFTMLESDVTVSATFKQSDWFTIKTNWKEWMSFFQNLGDYIVSGIVSGASGTGGNPLELLTISGIDFGTGVATLKDLGGISFKGVPMLFYCKGGLPEWLRFDPKAGVTAPEYDPQFKGGVSDLSAFADLSVYVLFGSELVKVDLSGSKLFDIYKAFVVANSSVASSRLFFVHGGTTAIDLIPVLSEGEGVWYDLQGRKLNGKPSKKGLYIMDGKKVIIK